MAVAESSSSSETVAPPQLGGIDYLEWWVGNARTFTGFLVSAFGFEVLAYAGPETGRRDVASYVIQQGTIRFVITGAMGPDSPVAKHVLAHGDGVHDLAFLVDDVNVAYQAALARGATSVQEPIEEKDDHGVLRRAAIATYGETIHSFIDRSGYSGLFMPQYGPTNLTKPVGPDVGLVKVDHVVGNVELGALEQWVSFYEKVMGFNQLVHFTDEAISTEYSALMSTVVWNGDKVVLPINEPAEGRRKSQIEEYLDFYGCPGVQHIAMRTEDIVTSVRALRDRGVRFLNVPPSYYDEAKERMTGIEGLPWEALADLGILVDRDHDGYLLQIFSETVTDRPTVFFEIIQREGAKGFGEGNFKALFQAIEREQEKRGNL